MKKCLLSINPKVRKARANRKRHLFKNGIFLISSGWAIPVFYSFLHFLAFMRLDSGGFENFSTFFRKTGILRASQFGVIEGRSFLSSHDSHIIRRSDPAAKDLLQNNLYILLVCFPDCCVEKPRRSPLRLRFSPCTRKNILRHLFKLFLNSS